MEDVAKNVASVCEREGEKEREGGGGERETDRQTDRQTHIQIERQRDRQTERQRITHKHRKINAHRFTDSPSQHTHLSKQTSPDISPFLTRQPH